MAFVKVKTESGEEILLNTDQIIDIKAAGVWDGNEIYWVSTAVNNHRIPEQEAEKIFDAIGVYL